MWWRNNGFHLGSTLANVFIRNFESIWLENCPSLFKPIVYRRFVDDKFLLFRSKDHVEKFRNCLNKQYKNIKVTSEIGENSSLSFLDIKISRENNKFVTSIYRKPTFSGVFTNFESFIRDIYKCRLIETLLHRSCRLCSNYKELSSKKWNFDVNVKTQFVIPIISRIIVSKSYWIYYLSKGTLVLRFPKWTWFTFYHI